MTRTPPRWQTTKRHRTHRMTTRNYKPRDEPDNVKVNIINSLINSWYREEAERLSDDVELLTTIVIDQRAEIARYLARINQQMRVIDIQNGNRIRDQHEINAYESVLHDIMADHPDIYWGLRHRIHFDDLQQHDPEGSETELETEFSDNDDGVIANEDAFWGANL